MELHNQAVQNYLAFIAATIAATIGGLGQLYYKPISILVIFGPILSFYLCVAAKRTCFSYYRTFLEELTITAKLEERIGLYCSQKSPIVFPQDSFLLPNRWLISRCKFLKGADFFEHNITKGVYSHTRKLFYCIQLVSVIIILLIAINFTLLMLGYRLFG